MPSHFSTTAFLAIQFVIGDIQSQDSAARVAAIEAFQDHDSDGDEQLSATEFAAYALIETHWTRREVNVAFELLDSDGDQKLTLDEFGKSSCHEMTENRWMGACFYRLPGIGRAFVIPL